MVGMTLDISLYEAVLFDFNGVLLLDSAWHEDAWRQTLVQLTQRDWTRQQVAGLIHGRSNGDIFEQVLARHLDAREKAELSELKESRYRATCLAKGPDFDLAPGASELLSRLRQDGVRITIASASGEINMRFYFQELDLRRWFDWDAIAYDDGTLPGKPAPDLYLRAAARLGVEPRHALAGMRAARNAGIGLVVAVGNTQPLPESDSLFDIKLGTLAALLPLL